MSEHPAGLLANVLFASFVSRKSQFHPNKVRLRKTCIKEIAEYPRHTIGDFLIDKQFAIDVFPGHFRNSLPQYRVLPCRRTKPARKLNFAHLIVKGGGISVSFENAGTKDSKGNFKQVKIDGKLTDYWGNELTGSLAEDLRTTFTKMTSDPHLLTYFRDHDLNSVKLEFSINNLKLTLNSGQPLIFDHYSQVEDPELLSLLEEEALVYRFDFVKDAHKHYAAGFGFQVLMDVLGFLDGHLAVTCRYLDSLDMLFHQRESADDDASLWQSVAACVSRIERFEDMWTDTFVGRKLNPKLEEEFKALGQQIFSKPKLRLQENLKNRKYTLVNNQDTPLEYKLISFGTYWSQITDPLPFTHTFLQKRTIITRPEYARDFVFCFPGDLLHQVLPNFLGFWSSAQPRITNKPLKSKEEKPAMWSINGTQILVGMESHTFDQTFATKKYLLASGFNFETETQEIVLFSKEQIRKAMKQGELPDVNCTKADLHTRYTLPMSSRTTCNYLTKNGLFTVAVPLFGKALLLAFTPVTNSCKFAVPGMLRITDDQYQDVLGTRQEEFVSVYYSHKTRLVFFSANYRDPKIDMPVDLRSDYAYMVCCAYNPSHETPLLFVSSGISPCLRVGSKHTWFERKGVQFLLISTNYGVSVMCYFHKKFSTVASTWEQKAQHLGEPIPREFFSSGGLYPTSLLLRHADSKPDAEGNVRKRLFYVYPHF